MTPTSDENPDWIVRAGLHTGYAIVLAEARDRDCAAALIDTNADRREVVLAIFERRTTGRWQEFMSYDDVDLGPNRGATGPVQWAYGEAAPRERVTVNFQGRDYVAETNRNGFWLFLRQVADDDGPTEGLGNPDQS